MHNRQDFDGIYNLLDEQPRAAAGTPGQIKGNFEKLGRVLETRLVEKKVFNMPGDNGTIEGGVPAIRSTQNGGQSWQSQQLNIEGRPEIIRFFDYKYGWLVERILTNVQTASISRLHRSTDGGETWDFVKAFDDRILDLRIRDRKQIFVCGESGLIASSHNGGLKWHRFRTGTSVAINFVTLGGDQTIVAGGDFGSLLLSRDHGKMP